MHTKNNTFISSLSFGAVFLFFRVAAAFDIKKVQSGIADTLAFSGADSVSTSGADYFFLTLKIVVILTILTLLVVSLLWVIKKSGLAGTSKFTTGSNMDLLEVLPSGGGCVIMLVRVVDKVYILGQTSGGINRLGVLEGPDAIEIIASSKGGTSVVKFKDMFNEFMEKMKKSS